MTDVQVSRVTDLLGAYRPPHVDPVTAADPWHVVYSPTVAGAYTAFRVRDEAVEYAARLYIRLGAVCGVDLHDGLPS